MNTEYYKERIKELENDNGHLRRRLRELREAMAAANTADMWWDAEAEQSITSLDDVMCDAEYDTVYEFDAAKRLPTQYVVKVAINCAEEGDAAWHLRPATPDEVGAYKAEKKRLRDETAAKFEALARQRQAERNGAK